MDTWDPKPDAPSEHRSIFKPISTNVPGMQFTELLAKTAKVADKLAVVRSMYHKIKVDDHPRGTQYILSGEIPGGPVEMPDIGSVVAFRSGSQCKYLPPYIMVPGNHEQAAMTRSGYLPPSYSVFKTSGKDLSDPNWKVPNLSFITGIDERRFRDRRDLLSHLDIGLATDRTPDAEAMKTFYDQAENLLTNPNTMGAFDLSSESDALRERYGRGHRGQCYLAGRKLVETDRHSLFTRRHDFFSLDAGALIICTHICTHGSVTCFINPNAPQMFDDKWAARWAAGDRHSGGKHERGAKVSVPNGTFL